eukprot:2639258-Amphidinium_carterae.1
MPGPYSKGKGVPLTMHPEARPSSLVPAVGQEVALLGPEAGALLQQRRMAERRWIFLQRESRGPDDSPFGEHHFDPTKDYRGVEWGLPVPPQEWARRCYVELNLASDTRHEGKGAPPKCHACHKVGSRTFGLAKCVCCENWACHRHLFVPACLDRVYPMCSSHPGYRQLGWIPTTYRVGEATMPGPSICSTNPGGWSNVEPVLDLGHDIVTVQETFVLRDK